MQSRDSLAIRNDPNRHSVSKPHANRSALHGSMCFRLVLQPASPNINLCPTPKEATCLTVLQFLQAREATLTQDLDVRFASLWLEIECVTKHTHYLGVLPCRPVCHGSKPSASLLEVKGAKDTQSRILFNKMPHFLPNRSLGHQMQSDAARGGSNIGMEDAVIFEFRGRSCQSGRCVLKPTRSTLRFAGGFSSHLLPARAPFAPFAPKAPDRREARGARRSEAHLVDGRGGTWDGSGTFRTC